MEKLAVIQNRSLRVAAGAYRATPIKVLHAEPMVPPIQEHLDLLQAKARVRLRDGGQAALIRNQRKDVAAKLRKRGTAALADTSGSRKNQWTSSLTGEVADARPPRRPPPWMEEGEEYVEQLNGYKTLQRQKKKLIEKHFFEKWRLSWESWQRKHDHNPTVASNGTTPGKGEARLTRKPG